MEIQKINLSQIMFTLLAERPEYLLQLALWNHAQWGYLRPHESLSYSVSLFQERLNKDSIPFTYIAILDEQPIGMFSYVLNTYDFFEDKSAPVLNELYIHPHFRSLNLFKFILNKTRVVCKERNFCVSYGYTLDQRLNNLYLKFGSQLIGESIYLGRKIWLFQAPFDFNSHE